MSDQWYYQLNSSIGDPQPVGSMNSSQLKLAATEGKFKVTDFVLSPTKTKNQWVAAQQLPPLAKLIQESAVSIPGEKPGKSQETALRNHVQQLLMSGEQIEFVCMQAKAMMLKRDAAISTNMRFMIAKPKMLGRFEFMDCMWIDLHDAHIKEGMFGATFQISSPKGRYTIEHLSKADARRLYQIAQDREQAARWKRRDLQMEESAAGAMQVNVNTGTAAQAPTIQPVPHEDPVQKLAKLKQMLDAGLIEQGEYDQTKTRILASM